MVEGSRKILKGTLNMLGFFLCVISLPFLLIAMILLTPGIRLLGVRDTVWVSWGNPFNRKRKT